MYVILYVCHTGLLNSSNIKANACYYVHVPHKLMRSLKNKVNVCCYVHVPHKFMRSPKH